METRWSCGSHLPANDNNGWQPNLNLLQPMQQELTIHGSRERFLWLLVFGVCFLLLGYWAFFEQRMWLLGGVTIAFAVFGLVITLLMMRPGSTYLRLDRQGFEIVAMRRRHRYAWSDVDDFYLCNVGGAEAVGIRFNASCSSQRIGREFAQGLAGVEGAIANVFTASPPQVCAILNEWKAEHGEDHQPVHLAHAEG